MRATSSWICCERVPSYPTGIVAAAVGDWRAYVEAKLGFRNHWYPVRFSHELSEGQLTTVQLLGVPVDVDGAGAAVARVATDVRPGQLELVPEEVHEQAPRVDVDDDGIALLHDADRPAHIESARDNSVA